jgi:hypothetical protein
MKETLIFSIVAIAASDISLILESQQLAFPGAEGYGKYASCHHNLIAHNNSRSPRINGSRAPDTIALLDLRNNVIFNWSKAGAIYGGELEIYAEDPEIEYSGAPPYNDHDGMPDEYELASGLDPGDSEDGKAFTENGYINLENYLNSIVPTEFTGIPEKIINNLRIYPNPSNALVFFTGIEGGARIEPSDITGRLVSVKYQPDQNRYLRIGNLNSVLYFMKFTFKNEYSVNHKIIKHRIFNR